MHQEKERGQTAGDLDLHIVLQDILDGVEDELVVINNEYQVIFANSAARSKFQEAVESPVRQLCYQVLYGRDKPCAAPPWNCPLREVLENGRVFTTVHPSVPVGDTYLKITAYPLRDTNGNIRAIVELIRDVTAERDLETQILRRHHQLMALHNISSAVSGLQDLDAVLRIALDNVLELINGTIGGILLLDPNTQTLSYRVQHGLSDKYTRDRKIPVGDGIAGRVAQSGESILVEDVSSDPRAARPDLVSAEGLKGFVSIALKVKDRVVGVMNVASRVAGRFGSDDFSLLNSIGNYLGTTIEQTRLYERLARVGERYQVLLQHALTAQEEERKRIARELHDETAQSLTSLTLSLMAIIGIAEMKGFGDTEFIEKLKKTHSYAVYAGNEVVKLMKELRPTLLDELGMPAAIHRYAKDVLQSQGINLSMEYKGTDQRFPPEVEVSLFRISQGVIGNVLEHSMAKNVSVKLECDNSQCVLNIQDDGVGFDVNKLTKVESSGRGAGLFTMRERANIVGGKGYVESQPGQGTKVTIKVPLAREAGDEDDKSTDR
ncbi:GAF domain-containing protein [Chloroflexota bacterium]